MSAATVLYTPKVLALATSLARFPLGEDLPLRGTARSQSCGSTLEVGFALDDDFISRIGLRSHACAVGQASATIFAEAAAGRSSAELAAAEQDIAAWLAGGPLPAWPGIAEIAAGVNYPGRHGAILLPWRAALSALPSAATRG